MIVYPTIPEKIVVHLGAPGSNAPNVTENFADYIKNVASSEIYPTWPEEAIKANVIAQISVALNRIYTEYYRSAGYDFDITSSPAYDQTYVYQRDIYDNISRIVDEIFNTYIRREGNIEPLYAEFCDGVEVLCDGLYQWGSVSLAEQGADYQEILRYYYGDNIELIQNVPVENIPESLPPSPLMLGDAGREVELIQLKLNRIASNYPRIPKIYPVDGYFDNSTADAVREFQSVFSLTPDGIVGRDTWYRIQFIYNAVKQLSSLNSEGVALDELSTQYSTALRPGDSSAGVLILQSYLRYISAFIPSIPAVQLDGTFGPQTENAVRAYQEAYGLPVTGEVDRVTWDSIENTYYGLIAAVDYSYTPGNLLPYPGELLRPGVRIPAVRVLQEYLNYIADTYPSIPKVTVDGDFGPATAAAVIAFKREFGYLNGEENPDVASRVNAQIWNAILSVYSDLYQASLVRDGQYPGYVIGESAG